MSLKGQIAKGSLWVLLGGAGQQLISFAIFIYVARLLNPEVLGIVAFAVIAVELASYVARWGQVEFLQRGRGEATSFWITIGTGLLASLVILAVGVGVAARPNGTQLAGILMWLSPLPLLQGASAVPEALLRRRLDFRSLAVRSWIATIMGGGAAIAIAQLRPGVEVLVGQRFVTAVVQFVALWAMMRGMPRFAFIREDVPLLVRGGFQILVASLSGVVNARVADGLTGAFLGAGPLGLLRVGWRFLDAIAQVAITPVAGVALSSFSQMGDDLAGLRRAYLRMTQLMSLVALPMFFGLGAVAEPLIRQVFGAQWLGATVVLQFLGVLMIGGMVNYLFAPVMIAVGRSDIVMRQSLVQLGLTFAAISIGVRFGLTGVMAAHSLRAFAVAIYNAGALKRVVGISPRQIANTLAPPTVACAFMWAGVALFSQILDTYMSAIATLPYVKLAVLVLVGGAVYILALGVGDVAGIWRGYIRDTLRSIRGVRSGGRTLER
jgi:PST family polysaccharide transporter